MQSKPRIIPSATSVRQPASAPASAPKKTTGRGGHALKTSVRLSKAKGEEGKGEGAGSKEGAINPYHQELRGDIVERNTVTPVNDRKAHPDPTLDAAVASMSFAGFDARRITSALRISNDTLFSYYRDAFENGSSRMIDRISGSLAQRALAGSDTAAIFLLKTRGMGQFSERATLDVNVEVTHKTALVSELAGMLSRGRVIDVEPEKEGAPVGAPSSADKD